MSKRAKGPAWEQAAFLKYQLWKLMLQRGAGNASLQEFTPKSFPFPCLRQREFSPNIKENFTFTLNGWKLGWLVTRAGCCCCQGQVCCFNPPNLSGNCLDLALDLVKEWRSLVEQVEQTPWRFVCGTHRREVFHNWCCQWYFQALWVFPGFMEAYSVYKVT